tara:strand:+ start:3165 stop:3926 length:762 start_codon:yes stop_codon:yes gene_type:complete
MMIEVFILSIIQGITEFLPISSSSHLILISEFFDFENQKLEIDISLHIGSFFAVVVYFRKDILNFFINKDLLLKILLSSIPVMIVGYFLIIFNLIDHLRNIKIIGWTTLIFGILLYISDKFEITNKVEDNFTYKSAIIIGLFQILSLIPGVSRSGITITAARILKFQRFDSAKISFLLSLPTLSAVTLFGFKNVIEKGNIDFSIINLVSISLSFFFSLITIKYFLKYIKNFSLNIFVFYRVILGIILIIFAYL